MRPGARRAGPPTTSPGARSPRPRRGRRRRVRRTGCSASLRSSPPTIRAARRRDQKRRSLGRSSHQPPQTSTAGAGVSAAGAPLPSADSSLGLRSLAQRLNLRGREQRSRNRGSLRRDATSSTVSNAARSAATASSERPAASRRRDRRERLPLLRGATDLVGNAQGDLELASGLVEPAERPQDIRPQAPAFHDVPLRGRLLRDRNARVRDWASLGRFGLRRRGLGRSALVG